MIAVYAADNDRASPCVHARPDQARPAGRSSGARPVRPAAVRPGTAGATRARPARGRDGATGPGAVRRTRPESGKTTTLVARICWRIATGADPASVCAVTFNRRAAEELRERLDAALEPQGVPHGTVQVRTFHALGRRILRDSGVDVTRLATRSEVIERLAGGPLPAADDAHPRRRLHPADARPRARPAPGPGAYPCSLRCISGGTGGGVDARPRRPRGRRAPRPARRPGRPRGMAATDPGAPRRRVAGPRPDAAGAGTAAGRRDARHLPGGRR